MKLFLPADSSLDDVVVKTWEVLLLPKLLEQLKKILQLKEKWCHSLWHRDCKTIIFYWTSSLAFTEFKRIWLKPVVITDKEKLLFSQWHWSWRKLGEETGVVTEVTSIVLIHFLKARIWGKKNAFGFKKTNP